MVEARSDIDAAIQAGISNKVPDDFGWTEMHMIRAPDATYASVGVELSQIAAAIVMYLPRICDFEVGFGLNLVDKDAQCYGFGRDLFVKLDGDDELLDAIWFDVRSENANELQALRQAFAAIEGVAPSIIADYWLNVLGPLGDVAFLDRYFSELGKTN